MSGLQKAADLSQGGWFDLSHWQVVRVHGPDTYDFLHRLTTWDAKKASPSRADRGAVLNGRAHAIAMGWFVPGDEEVRLVVPGPQGTAVAAHLEAMHFAENLAIELVDEAVFAEATPGLAMPDAPGALTRDGGLRWNDDTQPLRWVVVPRAEVARTAQRFAVPALSADFFEWLRIRDAIPEVGKELSPTAIVLEGNFEKPIARNKGCYPGQEVVERIFTYGQVNRKLYPIAWDAVRDPSPGSRLHASSSSSPAKVLEATVAAAQRNPDGQGGIGLALFPRIAWEYAGPWTATLSDGETISVRRR